MLHGQQGKVPYEIQWLYRQIPGLMGCLRATRLPILQKLYVLIPIVCHLFLRSPYLPLALVLFAIEVLYLFCRILVWALDMYELLPQL